jgi:hypothetical protein
MQTRTHKCVLPAATVKSTNTHLIAVLLLVRHVVQELSMWLYALTLLRLTPSPSWCAAFVEASFTHFTAPNTRPQVTVLSVWIPLHGLACRWRL